MTTKAVCVFREDSSEKPRTRFTAHFGQFVTLIFICTALGIGRPALAASPPGDVVGKVTVGYQGWFACTGDGSPMNMWWHWSANWSQSPSPSNESIAAWPDMRDYASGYQTAFANLGNGQPAMMFSSYDQQTVDTHFRWLAENGIDTAALQRFNPNGGEANRDGMAQKVKTAAETYGRKFYIMYDVTGWTAMQTQMKTDWITKMSAMTASPAYARQNGKPVVAIWGLGLNDANHPWPPEVCLDVVNWFKDQGCYVIGGVRREWRTEDPGFLIAYSAMNMISPWLIGAVGSVGGADNVYNDYMIGDQAYCNAQGIDYQPCVLPGDLSIGQRAHGNLMWRMFYNAKRVGCQGIYISMFDEYNEGNQIAKTAPDASLIPTNSDYLGLDEDGTWCSSDYYLRLTGDGGKMFKGQIALISGRPTQPALPATAPVAPIALTADSGNAQIMLSWAASPEALSYNVKRATTSGGSYTIVATNIGLVSYVDTGLVNGTTYYYVVSTTTSLGESPDSLEVSGFPFAGVALANSENPPNETAARAFDGLASTKWFASGNTGWLRYYFGGLTKTVVGYNLTSGNDVPGRDPRDWQFQGSQNGTIWTTLDTRAGEVFASRGLTKSYSFSNTTAYAYYRLNITANTTSPGNIQLAEMAFVFNPVTPIHPTATTVSSREISLNWTPAVSGIATYNVKRATSDGGPYTNVVTGINAPAFWDTGLAAGTTYYYVVTAANAGGESTNSVQVSATTQSLPPPTIPAGLTATPGNEQITLNWMPAMDAVGYNLKRSLASGGPYTIIASPTNTTYTNTGLVNNTTYYYVVSATNSVGGSTDSAVVSAIPSIGITTASAENPPNENAAKAFDGLTNTKWFNAGSGNTGWLQFQFTVEARAVIRYDLTSANDIPGRDPRDWQFQGSQNGTAWTTLDTRTGETFASRFLTKQYVIANTTAYAYYRLNITTNNGNANGIQLAEMAFTYGNPPAAPTSLTAGTISSSQIDLSWSASAGATGYNVKQATTSGGPYTVVATNLAGLAYTNTGLAGGTVYYFVVSAINAFGESTSSVEASAQTVSVTPPQLGFEINSGSMQFNWPADHLGWTLQVQTNAFGAGIGTNWVTVPDSSATNRIWIPIDNANGSVFFRLVFP